MSAFNENDVKRAGNGEFRPKESAEAPIQLTSNPIATTVPFAGQGRLYPSHTPMPPWPVSLPVPEVSVEYGDTGQLETYVQVGEDQIPFYGEGEDIYGIVCGASGDLDNYPDFAALSEEDREAVSEWGKKTHENATDAVRSLASEMIMTPDVQAAITAHAAGTLKHEPMLGSKRATERVDQIVSLYDHGNEPETYLNDIMTDLRHFADTHKIDFDDIIDRSERYYDGELEDDAMGNIF